MNFNIRVYSFLEYENKILLLKEPFQGILVSKLPGGGLEFGEGSKDCLKREYKEELNLDIEVLDHIYSLDYFIPSKQREEEQLFFVYYRVKAKDISALKVLVPEIQELLWVDINEISTDYLSLEADKMALNFYLKNQWQRT
jgi:8-oxo-dGTP diphosphatase